MEFSKTIFLFLGISLWLYWLWTRRHFYRFTFGMPGYFGLPLMGVFFEFKTHKRLLMTFTQYFKDCKSYTISLWLGLYPALLTAEPDLIEQIFSTPDLLTKAKVMYQPMLSIFEGGIIASPVEKWQHNRKFISPCFNHKVLLSFLPVFHKAKNHALAKMDTMVGRGEQNIALILQRIILGITIDNEGFQRLYAVLNKKWHLFRIEGKWLDEIILQKVAHTDDVPIEDEINQQTVEIKKSPKIFIEQAVQIYQKKHINWMDLLSESHTIVAASFETTANCVFSTLVMLAMHPIVQEKLYEELCCVFPEKDFELTFEHMKQLPYLDMVINETMRLAPPVPLIGRQVDGDIQLNKDLKLPKGLQILISIFNLHRRTDIWGPNAANFDPDNFLPKNVASRHAYAYIPFSKGSRNCIGWRYALFSAKALVAGLIRNYRFATSYKYEKLKFATKVALWFVEEPALEVFRR